MGVATLGRVGDARAWVNQAMLSVDSLNLQSQAQLIWTAQVAALEVGDDQAVLAAARQLEPQLPEIQEPFLQAVSALAMGWMSPLVNDMSGALRHSRSSLEKLRIQDEPFWTALAAGSLGTFEWIATRYDHSRRHLIEARERADRSDNLWLAPGPGGSWQYSPSNRGAPSMQGPCSRILSERA